MDLICHENFSHATDHHLLHAAPAAYITSANSNISLVSSCGSSSSSYTSPPYSSQYSNCSSSSGLGSSQSSTQSPPLLGKFTASPVSTTADSQFSATSGSGYHSDVAIGGGTVAAAVSAGPTTNSFKYALRNNNNSNNSSNSGGSPAAVQHNSPVATVATHNSHHYLNLIVRKADRDPIFLEERCLTNLYQLEQQFLHATRGCVQGEITPQMRKIVASWMMELCEGRSCQEEVCLLALNYMDRYLIEREVRKNHLQLLAAACLLLASKLREPSSCCLNADTLVYFTDNSIKKIDLINWELLVLSVLKWDISVVTPLDFLEHFLNRLPINELDVDKVRLHAQAFICLAAQENFGEASSTIAAASVAVAINGLSNLECDEGASQFIVRTLVDEKVSMGHIDTGALIKCMTRMETIYQEQKQKLVPEYILNTPPNSPRSPHVKGTANRQLDGQVVPATPHKCPRADDEGAANTSMTDDEGDLKF